MWLWTLKVRYSQEAICIDWQSLPYILAFPHRMKFLKRKITEEKNGTFPTMVIYRTVETNLFISQNYNKLQFFHQYPVGTWFVVAIFATSDFGGTGRLTDTNASRAVACLVLKFTGVSAKIFVTPLTGGRHARRKKAGRARMSHQEHNRSSVGFLRYSQDLWSVRILNTHKFEIKTYFLLTKITWKLFYIIFLNSLILMIS